MRLENLRKAILDGLESPYALWVIVGFGLVLRLAVLAFLSGFPLKSDAYHYHSMALQLLNGEDFAPYWPPGLPYFLAGVYAIFGAEEMAGRAAMLLFYLPFFFLLYGLGKQIAGPKAANLIVLFFSIYPTYVHLSLETQTQLPAAVLLLAAAALTLPLSRRFSIGKAALLGLVLGAAVLVRPSTMLLSASVPLFLFWKTKKPLSALLPMLVCAALVGGWLVKARKMTGDWIAVNYANGYNFFLGNNPYTPLYKTWWLGSHQAGEPGVPEAFVKMGEEIKKNPPAQQDRLYQREAVNHILSRPDLFLLRTFNRMRNYFAFDTFTGSYLIKDYRVNKAVGLVVLGLDALFYCAVLVLTLAFLIHSGGALLENKPVLLLLGLSLLYALPYWIAFSNPLYHFPVVLLLGLLAAGMAIRLLESPAETLREFLFSNPVKKRIGLLGFSFFAYIQLEWLWVMRDRL